MSDSFDQFIPKVYVKHNRIVEDIILERIRLWQTNVLKLDAERVFTLSGFPGVGKTWLLHYCKYKKRGGIYLDLMNFEIPHTPEQYLAQIQEKIQDQMKTSQYSDLFFIDHVPQAPRHPNLAKIEDVILKPQLEQGSFFVMAQQHPSSWCWSELPHPRPYIVSPFTQVDAKKIFRKMRTPFPRKGNKGYSLFTSSMILPGLISVWIDSLEGQEEDGKTAERFLNYWFQQVVPFDQLVLRDELRIAGAMTWVNSFYDTNRIKKILTILDESISHIAIREKIARNQWMTAYNTWEEPIRTILRVWFMQSEKALASKIQHVLGD